MSFNPGDEVRLRNDPGRKGTILNVTPQDKGDHKKFRVNFGNRKSWLPDYELEPVGEDLSDWARIIDTGKYGRPRDLRRSLTHVQLSGRLANLVYSMDATNTEFFPYQYLPVLRFLDSPSNGLLIADEVGLGKTIEAGLVWTELRARYDARRLVVFCPAMLREKWHAELRDRFGVDAEIVDAARLMEELKTERHKIPDGRGFVVSIQGARPSRGWQDGAVDDPSSRLARFLSDSVGEDHLIDLAVVDEAHYMRNSESMTAKLGELVRSISENVVLLSATPVNLKSEDLFNLLRLVDPDNFSDKRLFPEVLEANEPIQAARGLAQTRGAAAEDIRARLEEARQHRVLAGNSQLEQLLESGIEDRALEDDAYRVTLADKIDRINLLSNAVSRTRKTEVTEWRVLREAFPEFIDLEEGGVEREFYDRVTRAVREYAEQRDAVPGFLLASPQRQVSSSMVAAARYWQKGVTADTELIYEAIGDDIDENAREEDEKPLISHIQRTVLPYIDIDELYRVDSKYHRLLKVLQEQLSIDTDEKVIVFTYFREAARYLSERLSSDGIPAMNLVAKRGQSKQETIESFQNDDACRVLVSTEVGSEGVDLQFCRILVNYDLPWNPMKVEQRIGRLDRIGQRADKIVIWNLFHKGTIDETIYNRLLTRLQIFEKALGGMEAILGEEISSLTADILSKTLSEEEEKRRVEQTALAIERIRRDQEELEHQASQLIAHGGHILEKVKAAHDFKQRVTSEDLVAYVQDYLELHCPDHHFKYVDTKSGGLIYEVRLPPKTAATFEDFLKSRNLLSATRLATGEICEVIFKNKVKLIGERREVISQFHPLIRFIARELDGGGASTGFYPVAAVWVDSPPDGVPPGNYVYVIDRWEFEGLHTEEILAARCINLSGQSNLSQDWVWPLLNSAKLRGENWTSASLDLETEDVQDCIEIALDELQRSFETTRQEKQAENADRIGFQVVSAQNRRDREIESVRQQIRTLEERGRTRQLPAARARLEKLHNRFDVQLERLEAKRNIKDSRDETCVGVLRVTN